MNRKAVSLSHLKISVVFMTVCVCAIEIFVVTDMTKNNMRKTEYRLSTLHQDDFWAKLKRSDSKPGLEFVPLRKVLFLAPRESIASAKD